MTSLSQALRDWLCIGRAADNTHPIPCSLPALQPPSLLPGLCLSLGKKTLLQAPATRAAEILKLPRVISPNSQHTTLQGSPQRALYCFQSGFFLAPAIQCPRIMDRLQPKEFNSAPTPFRSEPVSAGCSYNKRLLQLIQHLASSQSGELVWTPAIAAPRRILMESHSCAWHLQEKV